MERLENAARPLIGLRDKSNEYWWPFPILVVYLGIDTSLEGKDGKFEDQ